MQEVTLKSRKRVSDGIERASRKTPTSSGYNLEIKLVLSSSYLVCHSLPCIKFSRFFFKLIFTLAVVLIEPNYRCSQCI